MKEFLSFVVNPQKYF